jgi:Na+/H+ antiporter NhaD/arsenite permease-like protein
MSMSAPNAAGPALAGVPVVFLLFAATLAGVLIAHRRAWAVALAGLAVIAFVRVAFSPFDAAAHAAREWPKLANLFGLLVGFAVLADHVDSSQVGARVPRLLPAGTAGCFVLLLFVWLLSGLLDNIAAALIGATLAARVFAGKVHPGYLVAIVAAANAGGAGSVIGDTTTTMPL